MLCDRLHAWLLTTLLLNCMSIFEPQHVKTNKITCAPSKDSDQPGHLPSLVSLRRLHEETLVPWPYLEHTAKNLIWLGGCPGWYESSLGAHIILLVLSCCGSFCSLLCFQWRAAIFDCCTSCVSYYSFSLPKCCIKNLQERPTVSSM